VVLNFLILAFVVFQMVRLIQRARVREAAAPQPDPAPPEDIVLLRQIRDSLQGRDAS
jgi:large conductance mechanosensitive channel